MKFYHLDIDPIDLEAGYESARQAEHDTAVMESHLDKFGTSQKANEAFLKFCVGAISEKEWLEIERENETT